MRKYVRAESDGRHNLDRAAEVLIAELVVTEEAGPRPPIQRERSVPARQGESGNDRCHQAGFSRSRNGACTGNQPRLNLPAGFAEWPSPWQSEYCSNIVQPKIILLLFA